MLKKKQNEKYIIINVRKKGNASIIEDNLIKSIVHIYIVKKNNMKK